MPIRPRVSEALVDTDPPAAGGGAVELVGLRKRYPGADIDALIGIDLSIGAGEFFSLLGPSGCGKTTTLRLVAGFEEPTDGQILLDGTNVARVPAHRRRVNTVFQSYALFPHLSVRDNVAFGLRFRKDIDKRSAAARVTEALALVELEGYENRRPTQLSGGQQQRVALARALVLRPRVLLLDEPLGALDAKLRRTLQVELKALQEAVGITFVYVTHDQEEALTMSDRLAVMVDGRVEQVGAPRAVYEEPASAWVAEFLGVSNLLDGDADGRGAVRIGPATLAAGCGDLDRSGPVRVVVRPECVRLEDHGTPGDNRLAGMVERLVYLGSTTQVLVRLASGPTVTAMVPNSDPSATGDALDHGTPVSVHLPPDSLRVLAR